MTVPPYVNFVPMPKFPIATTTPYTYTDGVTFLEQIEELRQYLNRLIESDNSQTEAYNTLVDGVNSTVGAFVSQINNMTDRYDAQLSDMRAISDDMAAKADELAQLIEQTEAAIGRVDNLAKDYNSALKAMQTSLNNALNDFDTKFNSHKKAIDDALALKADKADTIPKGERYFNIKDYGAVGDAVTNDTNAIVNAIEAAKSVDGTVFIPTGIYYVNNTITVPRGVTIEGVNPDDLGWKHGGQPENEPPTNAAWSKTNSAVYGDMGSDGAAVFSCGYGATIRNLQIRGNHIRGIGLHVAGDVELTNVNVWGFRIGVNAENLYYGTFTRLRTHENQIGVNIDHCYNLDIVSCRLNGTNMANTGGSQAVTIGSSCHVNFHGGAIEGFNTGVNITGNVNCVSFFGTYFETTYRYTNGAGARAIESGGRAKNTINLNGCHVYLTNMNAFCSFRGAGTNVTVNGTGNYFKGGSSDLTHYAYSWDNGTGVRTFLMGDMWYPQVADAYYFSPGIKPQGNSFILPPYNSFKGEAYNNDSILTAVGITNVS